MRAHNNNVLGFNEGLKKIRDVCFFLNVEVHSTGLFHGHLMFV